MTIKGTYPSTENFSIVDTIGVPHPYCITPRHIGEASDHFGGMLGTDAIKSAEKKGITCGVKGCMLPFDKHEQALLVSCKIDINKPENKQEITDYLLSIKEEAEKNGYVGFAFMKA